VAELTSEIVMRTLQSIEPRAERADSAEVVQTYVENRQLQAALTSTNNQVIFGRRGTGKTHALRYLAETMRRSGQLATYVSMDRLGSTQGIYSDERCPLHQRGVRLLIDMINELLNQFYEWAYAASNEQAFGLCDQLASRINEIRVEDGVNVEQARRLATTDDSITEVGLDIAAKPRLSAKTGSENSRQTERTLTVSKTGRPFYSVHVGAVAQTVEQVITALAVPRVWVFLDEWTELPRDLQPVLADMLRKVFFGLPQVTIKIAAISHRANFYVANESGDRLGLDVGGDIFGAVDLDEFVVFPAKTKKSRDDGATDFFRGLLYKHVQHALSESGEPVLASEAQFVSLCFTQVTALTEVARAAEGVPRDGIGIAARAALRARGKISTENVRDAAYLLFQSQKLTRLNGSPVAARLLELVIETVIGTKKARAFLLRQDHTDHSVISFLVDERLLHLIKRGYSAQDRPGERYDVLQIDYGCYVSLLSTTRAPESLLGFEVNMDLDEDLQHRAVFSTLAVPEHDNRAVRRAILDLPELLREATPAAVSITHPTDGARRPAYADRETYLAPG
jgi:hypothetical protein